MEPIRFDLIMWHFQVPRVCSIRSDLPAYMKSSKNMFDKKTNHIRHIHLAGKSDRDNHNNKMERLNSRIMDREKVFRGLKKFNTPRIDGLKTYYNCNCVVF